MDSKSINELYQHMEWADALLWSSILTSHQTKSDSRIREIFYHIHLTQFSFLYIWQKSPMEFPELSSFDTIESISYWGYSYHHKAKKFLESVNENSLKQEMKLPWAERFIKNLGSVPQSTTLLHTLIQVCGHSIHHRAQINTHLRQLGNKPPLIDFIAWIWLGKPNPYWPDDIRVQ